MAGVGGYVKFTAQAGRGDELAQLLLRAADSVRDTRVRPDALMDPTFWPAEPS